MVNKIFFCGVLYVLFTGTASAQNSIGSLKLLGSYEVPYHLQYNNTTIGGLSGIDYNPRKKEYYLISDDRSAISPARFYTAKINFSEKGIDTVYFTGVTLLQQKNGMLYPNSKQEPARTPDPEAIRYNPLQNRFVWSSEGERIVRRNDTVLENPSINIINAEGRLVDSFPIPVQLAMQAGEHGPRQNGVFEGLTFADNYKTLYVNVEEPLYDDGPRAGLRDTATWVRILKYDVAAKKLQAQYAYHPDAVPYKPVPATAFMINGLPDILYADHNHLLVMERAFSTGRLQCTIKIYLAAVSGASNIAAVASLKQHPPAQVMQKKLLLNMDDLGRYIDNVEGMTFGPLLPNGHKTLVLVADNNFNVLEKTQFFLFEVMP
ncbi:MAG TPA: esterase-like activity of phytase family protein [Chitinophagaceae bacterium]|nr:esterase-like activity of phytase family protein [Chitinophagaceae bacterium]